MRVLLLLLSLSCLTLGAAAPPLAAGDYEASMIEGWTIHVEKSLADHPRRGEALGLLETKLKEVAELVPPAALPALREVPIWLSREVLSGACYHPSAGWLKRNGRVVEMARSIELQNINHFIDWAPTQPLMVLHELAHAWHHRVLDMGYDNPEIKAAFELAVAGGRYAEVSHTDGRRARHYALTNPMEYFAECSEAYFGRNDFEPFDRAALKAFDPAGFALVEKMWHIGDAP